jgi:hypothetical protein
MKSKALYVDLLNSFGDPSPLHKYELLEENYPFCLLHNLVYIIM